MELSSEDLLRLNVLLANDIEAIRIDENSMTVYGLARGSEARVPLNPNCRPEKYLRLVREMLSSHVLGSPGGYPVFLQRWTRMGQARENRLDKLLLLGEPEAVTAVAGAPGLSDELARRTWWSMPTSDIARRLLEKQGVVRGKMGKELAQFLVEHLPFETDPMLVIATIRLVLQPGLIDAGTRERIFRLGTHRNVYHIGFLDAVPDELPDSLPARDDTSNYRDRLASLAVGNTLAGFLLKLLDTPGQTFLAVSEMQLLHPVDKYTVAKLMEVIGKYFRPALAGQEPVDEITAALGAARMRLQSGKGDVAALRESVPELHGEIAAMLTLAHAGEALVTPIIAASSASGTLLRRKLEPVLDPLLEQYAILRRTAHVPSGGRTGRRAK
ncbi:MAG: sulfur reduction protein DsrS [Gammaproteobacteria bacterium]|nr:sulfur reduction protein DsrS [Gammaproteobacteria bacterium]